MVLKRLGREAVLEEAIRESLTGWYAAAIDESGVVPVGDRKLTSATCRAGGTSTSRSRSGCCRRPSSASTRASRCRVASHASDEIVDQEVDAMRDRLARLETVERAAAAGDFAVIDYVGSLPADATASSSPSRAARAATSWSSSASESLIPGFEEGLVGAAGRPGGDARPRLPGELRRGASRRPQGELRRQLKEVRERRLPELDDDFAADAGFD